MKIQRKWRRAWQRGKRSYYIARHRRKGFCVVTNHHQARPVRLKPLVRWAASAAAAVMLTAGGAGVLAAPISHDMVNNIHTDGRTATSFAIAGNVNNITTGTIVGVNGINSFSQFNVKAGNTVNLHVPASATNLINLVSGGRSQINGIMNSVKDNKIGGNLFFLNPNGVVVGAGGSINAGSLAIYTPTQSFVDNFFANVSQSTNKVTDGTLSLSASGLITIEGSVNAANNMKFGSGGVTVTSSGILNIGAEFTASASFDSVVNTNAWAGADARATSIATSQDGSIEIIGGNLQNQGIIYSAGANILNYSDIATDGKTATNLTFSAVGDSWNTDITTTSQTGVNAFNSFNRFNAANGSIVNLIVPDTANNLINIVSGGRSEINGTVRSIKNGSVGGNLYFLNPYGLLVGTSGSIQAGSLTIRSISPGILHDYLNNRMWLIKPSGAAELAIDVDFSTGSTIDIQGYVTTAGDQKFGAEVSRLSGSLQTNGGNLMIHSSNGIIINNGAIISTRKVADGTPLANHADISVLSTGNSGDITLTVDHKTYHGQANIAIDGGAKLLSFASNGGTSYQGGDISAIASSQDQMLAWLMTGSHGPEAEVTVGNALLKGNNVTLQAIANNNAAKDVTFETLENNAENDDNLAKLTASDNEFISTLGSLRFGAVVYNVYARAKVTLNDQAKLQADKDVRINTEAASAMQSVLGSAVGGVGVALSKAEALTTVKQGAEISAGNSVDITAATKNNINMLTSTIPVVSGKVPLNMMANYAEMTSNANAGVEAGAAINAGGAVNVNAVSIKDMNNGVMASSPSNSYFSTAIAISKSDVNATAAVAGTIKAGGDLAVSAKVDTLQNKTWSSSSVGDGNPGSQFDWLADVIANGLWPKFKRLMDPEPGETKIPPETGITGAMAIMLSKNAATAKITSTGNQYVQSQGNITVQSDVTDLLKSGAVAQQKQRGDDKILDELKPANKKVYGVSAAVLYNQYDNAAKAFIGDDAVVDAKKQLAVNSAIHIPLPNNWADRSKVTDNYLSAFASDTLGVGNAMFSSWAQASSDAGKGSGSASVNITSLTNDAEAYIGKRAKINQNNAFNAKQAENDVSVTAAIDVTTLTMSGMLKSPLNDLIKGIRDWSEPMLSAFGSTSGGSGAGGSVLVTFEDNTARAYIDEGSLIRAHALTVDAKTAVKNISLGAAGGKTANIGFNGTATVNDIDNSTYAEIRAADVAAADSIAINAEDDLYTIDAAGGLTEAGSVGIGASIAYNNIVRDTRAVASGNLVAGDKLSLNAVNAGLAVTVSLAGSVAVDSPSVPQDKAKPDEYIKSLAGEDAVAAEPLKEVSKQLPSLPTKDSAGQQAQSGISVAGNVSLNLVDETALAALGNSEFGTAIRANSSTIESKNDTAIYAISGAIGIAANAGDNSTGIGGAFMLNKVNETTLAKADNAAIDITGATADALNVTATNAAEIVSIAASGGVAPQGYGVAGQVGLNMVANSTQAGIDNSTVTAEKPVTVAAADQATITAVGGAVAYGGKAGFGASIAVNLTENTTDAQVTDSTLTGASSDSDLTVSASEESEITAVTAAIGASKGSMAGAFSATGNSLNNTVTAKVSGVKTGGAQAVNSRGDVNIAAKDAAQVTSIAGSAGVAGGSSGVGLGASTAVLTTDNAVNAYVGDGTKLTADSVSLSAQSDQEILTIAAGGAGGGRAGVAGSATANDLSQSSDAHIGKQAVVDAAGNVTVNAVNTMTAKGLAGAVGIGKTAGVGVGADVAIINTRTAAYVDSGAAIAAKANVIVDAAATEDILSFAGGVAGGGSVVGVAGSASVHVMNTDTAAFIGRSGDTAAANTSVTADGSVAVSASDDSAFTGVAGSAAFSGKNGIDGSAGVDIMTKNTHAAIGDYASIQAKGGGTGIIADTGSFNISYQDYAADDMTAPALSTNGYGDIENQGLTKKRAASSATAKMHGVAVTAVSQNTVRSISAGAAAASTGAVTGSAAVNVVNSTTTAHVGKQAKLNTDIAGAAAQSVLVAAASDYAQLDVGGALAGGGTVGVGAGAGVTVLNNVTQAALAQNTQVKAVKDIVVTAASSQDIIGAAAALGAGGKFGVAGAVTANSISSNTAAFIGAGSVAAAGNNIEVAAKDVTEVVAVAGGAGIGLGVAGVGGSVAVTEIDKNTAAYIDAGATVDADAKAADTLTVFSGAYDSDGNRLEKQASGVSVKAASSEKITNVVASGGIGMYAGVAGAVNVNAVESATKAYIGDNAKINTGNTAANSQSVNVAAVNDVKMLSVSGAAGGGIVGVSGGVDVGIVRNDTAAYLGSATVKAKDDIAILAMARKDIASYAASLSGGGVGVAGSVSVYAIGANLSAEATDSLQAQKDAGNADNPREDNVQQYADGQIQTTSYAELLGQYDDVNIRQAGAELTACSGQLSISDDINNTTAAPGGTAAFVSANARLTAGGDLTITAQDVLSFKTGIGAGAVGAGAMGGAVSVVTVGNSAGAYIGDGAIVNAGTVTVNSDLKDQFNNTVVAGGLGLVGVAGAVSVVDDSSDAKASVGKVTSLSAGTVAVSAKAAHTVTGKVVGASAALVGALSGSVLTNTVSGGATAALGGTITSDGDITVQAETVNKLDSLVVAPSAGMYAGGAAVTTLTDKSGAKALITGGSNTTAAGNLTINSSLNAETAGNAVGVGAGGFAIGAAVASSETSGQSAAYIDNNSVVRASQAKITADGKYKVMAETTAGAGGLAAAGGSQATAVAKPVVQAYTGNAVSLTTSKDVTIEATATPNAKAEAKGYNFGGLSVGVSLANASANSSVDAHVGGSNTVNAANLRLAASLARQAQSDSVYANAGASGGGLIGVNATQSYATERSAVQSYAGDNSVLTVSGNTAISADAATKQTAISSAKSGGVVAAGANYSEAVSNSTITAYLGSGAKLSGGSGSTLSVTAGGEEYANANADAGIGGLIAGSAATAKTNATSNTQAYIGKAGDATAVTADTLSLSADHTSKVNTAVDSNSASVAGGSGAIAGNTVNSTVVANLNGTINTKKLTVKAVNNLLKPAIDGYNVQAGSGGLLNGAAAKEDSDFTGKTTISIGEGAVITISGDKRKPADTVFEALTNVDTHSSSKLLAGGAIEIARAESFITTNTASEVIMGQGSCIDSIGKVTLAAYTTAKAQSEVGVNVWGLAGSAEGASGSTITAANTVTVADNAKIRADDDINFYAGRSADGKTNNLTAKAYTDLYNNTAIPINGRPKADTAVTQTESIKLGKQTSIRTVADVNLLTDQGSVTSVGYGYAQDLYRKVLQDLYNAFSSLFGGGDLSLAIEYHSATPSVANTAVVVDGLVETGIQNKQVLIIDPVREADITTQFDSTAGTGQGKVNLTIRSSEGVSYTITKENIANNLINYRKQLVDLRNTYAADPQAVAAYTADIAYIDAQLEQMGLMLDAGSGSKAPIENYTAYYLTVDDVKARGGNINVNAKTLTGSGSLQAPKDSAITIINNSPLYLRTNKLDLDNVGGHVNFNGVEVTSAADITARNQGGAVANLSVSLPRGASDVNVSKVVNTLQFNSSAGSETFSVSKSEPSAEVYRLEAKSVPAITLDNAYDAVLSNGVNLKRIFTSVPNIQITDSISNPAGIVSVYNKEGSILLQGENGSSPSIVANTVDIKASRGSIYQSYTPGLTSIGGDPRSLWNQAIPGLENPDIRFGYAYDNKLTGKGGIYANGDVYISGQYLNINGTIQSGIPEWQVYLAGDNKYSGTFIGSKQVTLDEFIAAKQQEWEKLGRDPNTKYQITGLSSDPLGTIAAYYNPSTKRIELGDTAVQGGRIELFGQILNTGGGKINTLDGYASIQIANYTKYDLLVNDIYNNNIRGVIKITDTGKSITDASGKHYLVTQYQRNDQGKIVTTTYHTGLSDTNTTVTDNVLRHMAGGYSPVAGTRYVWTLGRDKTTTITTTYHNTKGNWGWDPAGWLTDNSTMTDRKIVVGDLSPLPDGAYAMIATGEVTPINYPYGKKLEDIELYRNYNNHVLNSYSTDTKSSYSSGFLGYYKHYVTERVTKTGSQDVLTFSAKADYPIDIEFLGYNAGTANVKVLGGSGNIIVNGSVINSGGEVKIAAENAAIISGNTNAQIAAQAINLSAGGLGNGIGANSPLSVQLLGETGALTAKTAAGAINLNGVLGDLRLNSIDTQSGDKYGKVSISADGSILQVAAGNNAVIRGSDIDLTSRAGSIGTAAQALNVSVMGVEDGDNINALAAKDINLRQPDGDFRLGHIESRGGDVTIEAANGSLIDANPIEAIDERTLEQMNALWDRMQVKQGAGAEAANEQALAAYADGKRADYFEYWRLRQVTPKYDDQGNITGYTANSYDPNYTYTPTEADKAMFAEQGLTAAQQQQYIDNKTQIYRTIGAQLGDAAYDPNYQYTITDADRANLTSPGWTESQLKYSLNIGIAKQTVSTDTTLQDPNVVGRHVKLIAKQGGVGTDNGEIVIDSKKPDVLKDIVNPDGSVTPSAARLALASAEADDITIKGDNIHVALRQAIYVDSETLEAVGRDHVYIGSAKPIYVKSIKSGSRVNDVNGAYDGTIRIKGKAGLYDVSTTEKAALQGKTVVIDQDLSAEQAAYELARQAYNAAQTALKKAEQEKLIAQEAYNNAKSQYEYAAEYYLMLKRTFEEMERWWNSLSPSEQAKDLDRWLKKTKDWETEQRKWSEAQVAWQNAQAAWAMAEERFKPSLAAWDAAQAAWQKANVRWAEAQTLTALKGGRTVIEAGFTGSIGTAAVPFSFLLTEGAPVTARAAGGIYLDSLMNKLHLAEIYSESDFTLRAQGENVLISSLQAQNAIIDAAVDDLQLYDVTIGNEAKIRNRYFTTIVDRTVDPKQLPKAELILSPGKSPFYLLMQGNKADTNAPILAVNSGRGGLAGGNGLATGGITLGGNAAGNDAGSVLNRAMNTRPFSPVLQLVNSPGGQPGELGGLLDFSPDSALQLQGSSPERDDSPQ